MKIIVGLGNPGEKYTLNRHNAGFMFVDYLYDNAEVLKPWKFDKYSNAEIAEINLQATSYKLQAVLAKPQTFMNRSGLSVKQLATNYKLQATSCYVAHDDLDIKLGEFKISLGKGPKLHNGIASVEDIWKTKEFWRVRIGVENRTQPIPGETYVLSSFLPDEMGTLHDSFKHILNADSFINTL